MSAAHAAHTAEPPSLSDIETRTADTSLSSCPLTPGDLALTPDRRAPRAPAAARLHTPPHHQKVPFLGLVIAEGPRDGDAHRPDDDDARRGDTPSPAPWPGEPRGVRVVEAKGPAARCGVLVDDVITALNRQRTDALPAFGHAAAQVHPGDWVELALLRRGAALQLLLRAAAADTDHFVPGSRHKQKVPQKVCAVLPGAQWLAATAAQAAAPAGRAKGARADRSGGSRSVASLSPRGTAGGGGEVRNFSHLCNVSQLFAISRNLPQFPAIFPQCFAMHCFLPVRLA